MLVVALVVESVVLLAMGIGGYIVIQSLQDALTRAQTAVKNATPLIQAQQAQISTLQAEQQSLATTLDTTISAPLEAAVQPVQPAIVLATPAVPVT